MTCDEGGTPSSQVNQSAQSTGCGAAWLAPLTDGCEPLVTFNDVRRCLPCSRFSFPAPSNPCRAVW
jgi:hypothetical protein